MANSALVKTNNINVASTTSTKFQIDSANSGPQLKNSSGVMQVRDSGDAAFAKLSVLTPTADENAATKAYVDGRATVLTKVLTGTTDATAGNTVNVAHGLTASKIVAIHGNVYSYNRYTPMNYYSINGPGAYPGGYDWTAWWDATNVKVMTCGISDYSGNVTNAAFTIIVFYTE